MQKTVHIVGAGISGLSAGVRLASAGYLVRVHEATQQVGGPNWLVPVSVVARLAGALPATAGARNAAIAKSIAILRTPRRMTRPLSLRRAGRQAV